MKRNTASQRSRTMVRAPQELRTSGSITDRIPGLSKEELANLRDNAERLAANGTPKQIEAAVLALPAITAELASRQALHKVALATARTEAKAERSRAASLDVVAVAPSREPSSAMTAQDHESK